MAVDIVPGALVAVPVLLRWPVALGLFGVACVFYYPRQVRVNYARGLLRVPWSPDDCCGWFLACYWRLSRFGTSH
jgi:hypothetical protein